MKPYVTVEIKGVSPDTLQNFFGGNVLFDKNKNPLQWYPPTVNKTVFNQFGNLVEIEAAKPLDKKVNLTFKILNKALP